jgi:hypothetical protein
MAFAIESTLAWMWLGFCSSADSQHRRTATAMSLQHSREFRGPVELFLTSIAERDSDMVRLVLAV